MSDEEESNLVTHARRELELVGEEQDVIEWFLRVVKEFASYGHSGGSASVCIPRLNQLLCYENLTPLTDDPKEWIQHTPDVFPPDGVWQNSRNGAAFSNDGGKTYYLLSEGANDTNRNPIHTSVTKIEPEQTACGETEDSAECACGCSGYDDRCPLYLKHYNRGTQVPESHGCCKIPGRDNAEVQKET